MSVPRRWSTLSQLQLATTDYEATCRSDPTIKSMLATGEITEDELIARATPRRLTTAAAFRRPDGSWRPTRRSHQLDVVQGCLSTGPAKASPRAIFLTGCLGVGQTKRSQNTLRDRLFETVTVAGLPWLTGRTSPATERTTGGL